LETPYYQVDVFSDELFGGNPLAVFLRGEDFTESQFQQVAREMNLSETTFIFPPSAPEVDFDIRVFTPEKEIPFAGHPTIGTAYVLRKAGIIPSNQHKIRLKFKAGVIPVQFEIDENIFMAQPPGQILQTISNVEGISNTLGLNINNIDNNLPIQTATTGFSALLVPLVSLRSIQRIELNLSLLKDVLSEVGVDMIYPFTREVINKKNSIHARGFAPFIGISEDPATGSVAGALGYYLNDKNDEEKTFLIEQGFEIKRPGIIHVEINGNNNPIRVGGKSRMVIKGYLQFE